MKTLVLQFIKSNPSGELTALKDVQGVEIIQTGKGFVPSRGDPAFPKHREAADQGLKMAAEALRSKKYDLMILDEICTAMGKGLISEDQIMELIEASDEVSCLVLTGRGATQHLIDEADTVTEMRNLKHGLSRGIKAQKGVEY